MCLQISSNNNNNRGLIFVRLQVMVHLPIWLIGIMNLYFSLFNGCVCCYTYFNFSYYDSFS